MEYDSEKERSEENIKTLHSWISQMCDPDNHFSQLLMNGFQQDCQIHENYEADKDVDTPDKMMIDRDLISVTGFKPDNQAEQGFVSKLTEDGDLLEGNFKNGVPHGFFRHLNSFGDVEFFGCILHGRLHGLCWRSLPGGGFLVSPSPLFSGDRVVFLYPDCRTALVGNFIQAIMVSARHTEVVGCSSACASTTSHACASTLRGCQALHPILSDPNGDMFKFEPAKPSQFCANPLLQDPYEKLFVEVRPSLIKGAGEGLFAKGNIEQGTVISFYNGVRVDVRDGKEDNSEATDYSIMFDEDFDLDVPPGMTKIADYRATLAHKVCHSFDPNSEFDSFYHPRFGQIRCVASLRDIEKGGEITVNYRYPLTLAPTWYKVEWARYQKKTRGLPSWGRALDRGESKGGRGSTNSSESSGWSAESSS